MPWCRDCGRYASSAEMRRLSTGGWRCKWRRICFIRQADQRKKAAA